MIIQLLKQKAFDMPPGAEIEAELQERLDKLYEPEGRCSDIDNPVFKSQLGKLKIRYVAFFETVGLAPDTLDLLWRRIKAGFYSADPEDLARGGPIKSLLENVIIYANELDFQPHLKELLRGFSRFQGVCTNGLIINLSDILYRLRVGKTPVHWLADLRETAHTQSVQTYLLSRDKLIHEVMEIHFYNGQKLLPIVDDLGLPTVPLLKKEPDHYADLRWTTIIEDLAIRDQFFVNYTTEDHLQYIKYQFMELLKDYWDKEFGVWDEEKEGLEVDQDGDPLDDGQKARRKKQRACDDGNQLVAILQPFIDKGVFTKDDIMNDDFNGISQLFKEAFDDYCEILSRDFLYTAEEQEEIFGLCKAYLTNEEDIILPEGSQWLALSPLGLEFLFTLMLDPDFALDEIKLGRIAELFDVPGDINNLEARLKVSLQSNAHDIPVASGFSGFMAQAF